MSDIKKILIGSTGLIGKTLSKSIQFDYSFNSKNINEFEGAVSDGCDLYLACLPATKWLVNQNIKQDLDNINNIINIISKKKYQKVTLISTIDVYSDSELGGNESDVPVVKSLNYGSNRYLFELLVEQLVQKVALKIFRLPALYSLDIKKNILFDLLNRNNIHKINSNSIYQWYDLNDLAPSIEKYHYYNEKVINLFPEGIRTYELIEEFFPQYEKEVLFGTPVFYDYCTKFSKTSYLYSEKESKAKIKNFINEYRSKQSSVGS
jgi:hypothetical protein